MHEISLNPKVAAVPIIDVIKYDTLELRSTGHGSRGGFNWDFRYQWFPLRPEDKIQPDNPFQLGAMTGGAYAINREYFFKLGGYDEGLYLWNAENYEISFKLHMCGGNILLVPCSRVGHINRKFKPYPTYTNDTNFSLRNLKRIVEVFLSFLFNQCKILPDSVLTIQTVL